MCESIFLAVCQGVKKRVFEKNVHFLFLSFLCWKKKKRKHENNGKRKFQKKPRKIVFFGWLWRKMFFFVKLSFFRKIGKHYLCSEGKKKVRIFVATICFWKMSLFLVPIKSHQTLQKSGFQRTQGKTQNGTFGCKSAILGFPSKRGFTICDAWKLCFAENTIFIVFSAKHSFVDLKECTLIKKTKILQK